MRCRRRRGSRNISGFSVSFLDCRPMVMLIVLLTTPVVVLKDGDLRQMHSKYWKSSIGSRRQAILSLVVVRSILGCYCEKRRTRLEAQFTTAEAMIACQ